MFLPLRSLSPKLITSLLVEFHFRGKGRAGEAFLGWVAAERATKSREVLTGHIK